MPLALERKLKQEARAEGFTQKKGRKTILSKRGQRYVYSILRKTGWKPNREQK